ncbi:MAG: anti-sigma factor [Candidatus Promineifilaceae bacterium]
MYNQNHNAIIELIPAYALSALDAEETAVVTQHLKSCALCQAELEAFTAVVDTLPLAAADNDPSPQLKEQLLARVQKTPATENHFRQQPAIIHTLRTYLAGLHWQTALAFAALVILVGAWFFWQQSQSAILETVPLTATNAAPGAEGTLTITRNGRRATLTVTGLPTLPPNQQYQLWLIQDGQRISGAVFSVNEAGQAEVSVHSERPLTEFSAFGITIEPAGGSPGPTGERVLGHNL